MMRSPRAIRDVCRSSQATPRILAKSRVFPTHFAPQMARGILIAAEKGLRLPIVYNTNAYDSVEVLKLLDGIVDIYLPDLKYADSDAGFQYSKVRDYKDHARAAINEMHRQVGGSLQFGED